MTLSQELRDQIYELCLRPSSPGEGGDDHGPSRSMSHGILVQRNENARGDPQFNGTITEWRQQPPLSKVSRQFRKETLPIYYSINEFVAYGCRDLSVAARWLDIIGKEHASQIRQFTFVGFKLVESEEWGETFYYSPRPGYIVAKTLGEHGLSMSCLKTYKSAGDLVWDGAEEASDSET